MIYLLAFVVVVLAAARVTGIFLWDEITRPWREKRLAKHPPGTKINKLLTCYWCFGFWVSLLLVTYLQVIAVAVAWLPWHTLLLLPLTIPAVAYGCGWVLDKEQESNVRT